MKNLVLLVFLSLFMNSCQKSDDVGLAGDLKKATIIYAGEFESDGCGWLIKVGATYYFPVNLSEDLHKNEQDILVSFQVLDEKVTCGFPSSMTPQYDKVEILEIELK